MGQRRQKNEFLLTTAASAGDHALTGIRLEPDQERTRKPLAGILTRVLSLLPP